MSNTNKPSADVTNNTTLDNAVGGLTPELGHTPERHDSIMQRIKNAAMSKYIALALLATTPALESCTDKGVEPIEQVDPNKLTPEEQKFADLLAPNKDGSPKSITIDIGDPSSPFYMPKLFRIELKLVNAKAGTLEITPYISKAPIANALNKAVEMEPGKIDYGSNISLVVKKSDGSTYSPTGTVGVGYQDDKNPLTIEPYLAQLPESFTFDEFRKFYTFSTSLNKSYTINKLDELQLWIETATVGRKFETIKLPIKPVEISAVQNTGN